MSVDRLAGIALCCSISARMLEIADESGVDEATRARLRQHNCRQALLLREAAEMAAAMADEVAKQRQEAA